MEGRGGITRGTGFRGLDSRPKDPRIWNREEYHRLEKDSFTVFLDNLPEDISRRELYQLFCWTGRINDIYISRKQKNGRVYIFAFVRYTTKGGALKAIAEMNQFRLRRKTVYVGEAKFRKNFQVGNRRVNVDPGRDLERKSETAGDDNGAPRVLVTEPEHMLTAKEPVINPGLGDPSGAGRTLLKQGKGCSKRVEVPIVVDNMNWLVRSLVGSTLKPIDLCSLKRVIQANLHHVEAVREIGETKVLVTFETVEYADEAYKFKMDTLLQVLHRVRRWEETERCVSRKVWLECHGVPLHVWSPETFTAIGGLWGNVLHCPIQTGEGASFRVGRIEVETEEFDTISDWVQLAVGKNEFTIIVKEVGLGNDVMAIVEEEGRVQEGHDVAGSCVHSMKMAKVQWDPAADLIIGNAQGGECGEDRIVIPEVIFNDVNVEFSNFKHQAYATDSVSHTQNLDQAVMKGYGCEEVDSDRTVTEDFGAGIERDFGYSNIQSGPLNLGQAPYYRVDSCRNESELGLAQLSPKTNQIGIGLRGLESVRFGWENEGGPDFGGQGLDRVAENLTREEAGRAEGNQVQIVSPAVLAATNLEPPVALVASDRVGERVEDGEARPLPLCQLQAGSSDGAGLVLAGSLDAATLDLGSVQVMRGGVDGGCELETREGLRWGTGGRVQGIREVEGDLVDMDDAADGAERLHLDRLGEKETLLGANRRGGEGMQALAEVEDTLEVEADSETGGGRTIRGAEDRISKEAQVKENQETWALAVESGAVLYDEDVDIMSILQAQNEKIAEKRKLAKRKEKARRSRPKNKCKVSNTLIK
ncbi:hypothetical protein AHAS_Ahas18G0101500 [Arachis hypogaea]